MKLSPQGEHTGRECQHAEVERIIYFGKSSTAPSSNVDIADDRRVDCDRGRYPFCIVFIPFPILSWVLPLVGHYGIGMSDGRVRDFSGNYHTDYSQISYGTPTKYCQLDPSKARGGVRGWDYGIAVATNEYLKRHGKPVANSKHRNPSHVVESLNTMFYAGHNNWNRCKLFCFMTCHSRYTSLNGVLRTWLPFWLLLSVCSALVYIMWIVLPSMEAHPGKM